MALKTLTRNRIICGKQNFYQSTTKKKLTWSLSGRNDHRNLENKIFLGIPDDDIFHEKHTGSPPTSSPRKSNIPAYLRTLRDGENNNEVFHAPAKGRMRVGGPSAVFTPGPRAWNSSLPRVRTRGRSFLSGIEFPADSRKGRFAGTKGSARVHVYLYRSRQGKIFSDRFIFWLRASLWTLPIGNLLIGRTFDRPETLC